MADTPTISNGLQLRAPDPNASNGVDLDHAVRTVETGETFSETKTDRSSPKPTAPAEPQRPPPREGSTSRRVASLAQRERLLEAREQEIGARETQLLATNPEYAGQIQQARQVRALEAHAKQITQYVSERPDEYEMLNVLGRQEEVAVLQFAWFQRSGGQLITAEQAARMLEEHYAAQADEIASKRKRKSSTQQQTGPTRTLSSSPRRAPDFTDNRPHDEADRMRRAVAAWDAVTKRNRDE